MAFDCPETIVQLDGQEQQPLEQRHTIAEAVKKFSSLAKKGSGSRADLRKPFFPVQTKSPKTMLQPWPSATNISRSSVASTLTPFPTSADSSPGFFESVWKKDSITSLYRRSSVENSEGRPSVSSRGEKSQEGVVNSAFAGEKMNDVPDICDCDDEEHNGPTESSPSRQCRQLILDQHLLTPETIDMSTTGSYEPSRSRTASCSKYLTPKKDDSRKKRSFQWRSKISEPLKFRRRTTDSIPTVITVLSHTRSTPDLRDLNEQTKTAQSEATTDTFRTQENDTKL